MEGACKERHLERAPAQVGEEVRKVDRGGLVSPYLFFFLIFFNVLFIFETERDRA